MPRATDNATAPKNGNKAKPVVSKLGRDLRRIREKIEASGEKMFTPPLARWTRTGSAQ
jgi:hypothetical protein